MISRKMRVAGALGLVLLACALVGAWWVDTRPKPEWEEYHGKGEIVSTPAAGGQMGIPVFSHQDALLTCIATPRECAWNTYEQWPQDRPGKPPIAQAGRRVDVGLINNRTDMVEVTLEYYESGRPSVYGYVPRSAIILIPKD